MLWQRVVTALVLLPLVLGAIFFLPNAWFAVAIAAVVLLAGEEWGRMAPVGRHAFLVLLTLALAGVFLADILAPGAARPLLWAAVAFWLVALVLVLRYPAITRWSKNRGLMHGIGLLLLVPAWYAVVYLQSLAHGGWVLLGGLFIVWGADVGAYFAGRAFGRRKLAPAVSPGKSVEGALGGVLLTQALALGVALYLGLAASGTLQLLLLVFVATLASILGDLFESMAKREAGVKDSGTLLPGHGGVLDRIDSVTCALPVFALGFPFVNMA